MEDRTVIHLHVQPGAPRTRVVGRHGDGFKVAVAAPADRGRANEAVLDLVAAAVGVPRSAVRLVTGGANRSKRVEVLGMGPEAVGNALDAAAVARRRR